MNYISPSHHMMTAAQAFHLSSPPGIEWIFPSQLVVQPQDGTAAAQYNTRRITSHFMLLTCILTFQTQI